MDETEKYLFEVHGYLVIKEVLTPEQLAAANLAVDRHADQIQLRPNDLANESQTLKGTMGRGDLGGMLTWEKPYCEVFREVMVHPRLTPYLETVLGAGFRLEGFSMLTMD